MSLWVSQRSIDVGDVTDYLTSIAFQRLPSSPTEEDTQHQQQQQGGTIKKQHDEAPNLVGRRNGNDADRRAVDDDADHSGGGGGRLQESLLCTGNNGAVFRISLSRLAAARTTAASSSSSTAAGPVVVPPSCITLLPWRHEASVLGLAVHDLLTVAYDDSGTVVVACADEVVAVLRHDRGSATPRTVALGGACSSTTAAAAGGEGGAGGSSTKAVRAVLVFDGFPEWMSEETKKDDDTADTAGEEAAVYLFTACDDGFVRLWRVRVDQPMQDAALLAPIVVFGPPGCHVSSAEPSSATHPAIFSLAIDVDARRLVAGTALGGWFTWSLAALSPLGLAVATPPSDAVAAAVWAGSASRVVGAVAAAAAAAGDGGGSSSTVKLKVRHTATGGRAVGVLGAIPSAAAARVLATPAALQPAHDATSTTTSTPSVPVLFPGLAKSVEWPSEVLRYVVEADGSGSPDPARQLHVGPVYRMHLVLDGAEGSTLLATAGSDGCVCLSRWGASGYRCVARLRGHTDLVRSLLPTADGAALLSASYDGTVREWHRLRGANNQLEQGPTVAEGASTLNAADVEHDVWRCTSVLMVEQGSQELASAPAAVAQPLLVGGGLTSSPPHHHHHHRHSVACAELFEEASVLFTVSLFERTVRTFVLMRVDTCDPPPGFVYNGRKTLPLLVRQRGANGEEEQEEAKAINHNHNSSSSSSGANATTTYELDKRDRVDVTRVGGGGESTDLGGNHETSGGSTTDIPYPDPISGGLLVGVGNYEAERRAAAARHPLFGHEFREEKDHVCENH